MSEKNKISRRKAIKYLGGIAAVGIVGAAGYEIYQSMQGPPTPPASTTTVSMPPGTTTAAATTSAPPFQYSTDVARGVAQFTGPPTTPLAEPKDWTSPPSAYSGKKEIVVGVSMPLTGMFSWATPWAKEYEQWVKMLNDKGGLLGLPVRLLMYDSGSDVTREIANNTKLITVDKVDLLLGGTPTANILPVYGAIDKYGYVIVNIGCATIKGMDNPPFENIFNLDLGRGSLRIFVLGLAQPPPCRCKTKEIRHLLRGVQSILCRQRSRWL